MSSFLKSGKHLNLLGEVRTQARPGRHGQVWCIRRPEKGTWGQSKDVSDRESHSTGGWGDGMGGIVGIREMLPNSLPPQPEIPTSCSTEQMAKPTPLYTLVKPRLRAGC